MTEGAEEPGEGAFLEFGPFGKSCWAWVFEVCRGGDSGCFLWTSNGLGSVVIIDGGLRAWGSCKSGRCMIGKIDLQVLVTHDLEVWTLVKTFVTVAWVVTVVVSVSVTALN